MMSNSLKNIIVRVIKHRMSNGEVFDEIISDYPKLTAEEIKELREAVAA